MILLTHRFGVEWLNGRKASPRNAVSLPSQGDL